MSLSVIIDALIAAGCSAEQIGAAVKAHEAQAEEKATERRAKAAAKKRRQRAVASSYVPTCPGDNAGQTGTDRDSEGHTLPLKERSPAPPKENNPLPFASLRSANLVREEFDRQFWPAYPHKTGKPAAFRSFAKARKDHELGVILAGLGRYVDGKPADRPWLNPATFLNQERYLDQPAAVTANGSRAPPGVLPFASPPPPRPKLSEAEQMEAARKFHESWSARQ